MKAKKTALDVDFIGGQKPLTEEEEMALAEFFAKRKSNPEDSAQIKKNKKLKRKKTSA